MPNLGWLGTGLYLRNWRRSWMTLGLFVLSGNTMPRSSGLDGPGKLRLRIVFSNLCRSAFHAIAKTSYGGALVDLSTTTLMMLRSGMDASSSAKPRRMLRRSCLLMRTREPGLLIIAAACTSSANRSPNAFRMRRRKSMIWSRQPCHRSSWTTIPERAKYRVGDAIRPSSPLPSTYMMCIGYSPPRSLVLTLRIRNSAATAPRTQHDWQYRGRGRLRKWQCLEASSPPCEVTLILAQSPHARNRPEYPRGAG